MTDILLIFFGFYRLCTPKNKNVYHKHLKGRKELQSLGSIATHYVDKVDKLQLISFLHESLQSLFMPRTIKGLTNLFPLSLLTLFTQCYTTRPYHLSVSKDVSGIGTSP